MIINNLERRDREARSYLKESRDFAAWAQKDREKKLIPLTDEQREGLQNYLAMMKQSNKEVYPYENASSRPRQRRRQEE